MSSRICPVQLKMFSGLYYLLAISSLLVSPWNTVKEAASEESSIENIHFIATLSDQLTETKYLMEEWIQVENKNYSAMSGKIELTRVGFDKVTIFYRKNSVYQLVMYGNQCLTYKEGSSDKKLPITSNPLERDVLMSGPAFYFMQLKNNDESPGWTLGEPVQVRGVIMRSQWSEISPSFNFTVYTNDRDWTLSRPLRVDLSGFSDNLGAYVGPPELLSLNFYTIEYSTQDFNTVIAPIPGIGCLRYFGECKPLPTINFGKFHYYTRESLGDNGPLTQLEVFVDKDAYGVITVPRVLGNDLKTFANYRLGTKFTFTKDGKCHNEAIPSNEKGVVDHGFQELALLWMTDDYNDFNKWKYVGTMFYDHRSGILCDVWESMDFNGTIDGETFSKVVTTHYFTENPHVDHNSERFDSEEMLYIPVGSTRIAYNLLDDSDSYVELKFQRRDIYEFGPTIEDSEYRKLFQLSDCYPDPSEKLSLMFDIRPQDSKKFNESLKQAEERLYDFRQSFERYILRGFSISKFRVASIDFDFTVERILANVVFLEKPPFEAYFTIKSLKIKDISSMGPRYPDSLEECFEYVDLQFSRWQWNGGFLWCDAPRERKACVPVRNKTVLIEEVDGIPCQLYRHPVGFLNDVALELPLKSIHDHLLENAQLIGSDFAIFTYRNDVYRSRIATYYHVESIMNGDMPDDVKTTKQLFRRVLPQVKLSQVKSNVQKARGSIQTFGDCYRACKSSDQMQCSAFSYCSGGSDDKKCLLTDEVLDVDQGHPVGHLQDDLNCDVYEKQHLLDYQRIDSREFINTGNNQPILTESPENCAKKCAGSKDCDSFQFCDENLCFLVNAPYLASKTQPKYNCSIYTPKKFKAFKITGSSLVKEIIHTEVDINLDQCATLCFQYNSGEDECQSFNYCPKGTSESSCQLAKVKVSTSKQESISSVDCKNYELIEATSSKQKRSESRENVSKASAGKLFAIIMLFGLVGLTLGAAISFGWFKYSQNSVPSQLLPSSIPWSKQRDEEDQVQINSRL